MSSLAFLSHEFAFCPLIRISLIHVNAIRKLSYPIYVYNQDMLTTEEVNMMFPEYSFLVRSPLAGLRAT
jgi:hypothetical protein